MTIVSYVHTDERGNETEVRDLFKAQELKEKLGGTYRIKYTMTISDCEAYSRVGARRAGELR